MLLRCKRDKRRVGKNMKKDLALRPVDFTSSFLSCEKDLETILRKLFVESQPYSDKLKKLLVINTKDCLDS